MDTVPGSATVEIGIALPPWPGTPELAARAEAIGQRMAASRWPSERDVAGWLADGTLQVVVPLAPGATPPVRPPLARFAERPPAEAAILALLDASEAGCVSPPILMETVHRMTDGRVSGMRSVNSWSQPDRDGRSYQYPAPDVLRTGLTDLCRCINGPATGPPVLDALHVLAEALRLHAFTDGNGRLARALFNAALAARGLGRPLFPLGPLLYANAADFVIAIRHVWRSGDWPIYMAYMLAVIECGVDGIGARRPR